MWQRVIQYGASTIVAGGAGGYWYIKKQHQIGMAPSHISYSTTLTETAPCRENMLTQLKKENFDLIVIGGGATGSGVTMDGATRGLKCALIEADDFASGTSSRSTKLLHGGVRYLEAAIKELDIGQLSLVWEALEERAHMLKCAPYMSKPLPIVMPLYQLWQVPYCWFGVKVYDWLAKLVTCFDTGVPDCFYISKANSKFFFPQLKPKGLKGSIVYYDGQHNDARMNLTLALNATIPNYIEGMQPAVIANHCKVIKVLKDDQGKAIGVRVYDKVDRNEFDVFGKVLVNCTGPGADIIRKMADPDAQPLIGQAAGSHVVLPKYYTQTNFGMIIPQTSDGRVLFLLPWEESTIVGTTDKACEFTELPKPTRQEIDFILKETAKYIQSDYETLRKDVKSAWCGLRPLVKDPKTIDDQKTAKLSRSHEIVKEKSGLISVMGGKWTTYRKMAQDAVDLIVSTHPDTIIPTSGCRTKQLKLYPSIDATGKWSPEDAEPVGGIFPRVLQSEYNLTSGQASHLVRNYGFLSRKVCELGKKSDTLVPIHQDQPFLMAEILYSVKHEMAQKCADVLGRRLRIAFVDSDTTSALILNVSYLLTKKKDALQVANFMASELNWSESRKKDEVAEALQYVSTMQA